MKKVTMTFVVEDEVVDDIHDAFIYGDLGNAAKTLNENCLESDYNVEDTEL